MPHTNAHKVDDPYPDSDPTITSVNLLPDGALVIGEPIPQQLGDILTEDDNSLGDVWADDDAVSGVGNSVVDQNPYETANSSTSYNNIPSPDKRLYSTHSNTGYRVGLEAARAKVAQPGFDAGYAVGGEIGMRIGELLGLILGALTAIQEGHVLHAGPATRNSDGGQSSKASAELGQQIEQQWMAMAREIWDKFGKIEDITKELGIEADMMGPSDGNKPSSQLDSGDMIPKTRTTNEVLEQYTELQRWMGKFATITDRLGVSLPSPKET